MPITNLIAELGAATSFEGAAERVLPRMLDAAGRALAASAYADHGRILRAMVHVRPEGGYRRLAVLEHGKRRIEPAGTSPSEDPARAYVPSATAWRFVAEHRTPVAVDVHLGRVEPHGGAPVVVKGGLQRSPGALGGESVARLLRRAASHLYVLPLAMSGAVVGMISIEAECQRAMGRPFIWSACQDELLALAGLAAPHLASLPLADAGPIATDAFLPVVGASMSGLIRIARVFAEQDETLLVTGPTGAGKSRLARWCHEQSSRRANHYEGLDLSTVPEELQMGELFGWRKGAFSGASSDNPGCLARAERGTLFIDELDKLSLKAQAGLLRVLDERAYRPLGEGTGERRADVRFLVGTNADLMAEVRAGRFREDLYYRIHVLPLRLPPLDERTDEIAGWAAYMLERRHRERAAGGEAALAEDAVSALLARRWPGNLRQLDNVVRRAYALAMVDQGASPGALTVGARHVDRALGYEAAAAAAPLVDVLRGAAAALLREAERRQPEGEPLDLDVVDALRGLALSAAAHKLGSKEAALRLFGKESVVQSRNHQRAFKRDIERAMELLRTLGPSGEALADELARGDAK
ncbi:MAG: sigma-54-dependent Fis family transcriptional regulator [Polyangiaceae bacterium]|nr:sigma-54-dependent Fis family transcriptional regulator [Polyangiaceae bacterium]